MRKGREASWNIRLSCEIKVIEQRESDSLCQAAAEVLSGDVHKDESIQLFHALPGKTQKAEHLYNTVLYVLSVSVGC